MCVRCSDRVIHFILMDLSLLLSYFFFLSGIGPDASGSTSRGANTISGSIGVGDDGSSSGWSDTNYYFAGGGGVDMS